LRREIVSPYRLESLSFPFQLKQSASNFQFPIRSQEQWDGRAVYKDLKRNYWKNKQKQLEKPQEQSSGISNDAETPDQKDSEVLKFLMNSKRTTLGPDLTIKTMTSSRCT